MAKDGRLIIIFETRPCAALGSSWNVVQRCSKESDSKKGAKANKYVRSASACGFTSGRSAGVR
jgi:hypothetical protein